MEKVAYELTEVIESMKDVSCICDDNIRSNYRTIPMRRGGLMHPTPGRFCVAFPMDSVHGNGVRICYRVWKEIIPEREHVISNVVMGNGKLLVAYTEDVMSHLYVYTLSGDKLYEVELPGIGSVNAISAQKDEPEVFYSFTSFTYPQTTFRLDTEKNQSTKYFAPETGFDSDNYESIQVFYQSKDGTRIPMTLTYKKGIKLDGNNPTLLYGSE